MRILRWSFGLSLVLWKNLRYIQSRVERVFFPLVITAHRYSGHDRSSLNRDPLSSRLSLGFFLFFESSSSCITSNKIQWGFGNKREKSNFNSCSMGQLLLFEKWAWSFILRSRVTKSHGGIWVARQINSVVAEYFNILRAAPNISYLSTSDASQQIS